MQPLRLAANAKSRLVHVFHRRARHVFSHCFGKAPQTLGASPAHSRDRRGGQFHAEEIGHQFGQAILRQQLIMQQIDHEGGDSDAILNGRVDTVRKRRSRLRAAGGALAIMRTMFGDDERLRLGQIKHLTSAMADTRFRPKARTAPRAGRRVMIGNVVRIRDLAQGLALVTLLSAPLLAGPFPQALHTRTGFFSPSLDGGLASVRAVQIAEQTIQVPRSVISASRLLPSTHQSASSVLLRTARFPVSQIIQFFNRKPLLPSREIYRQFKSRSPNLGSNHRVNARAPSRVPA